MNRFFELNQELINNLKLRILTFAPSLIYAILILAVGLMINRMARAWLAALLDRSHVADDLLLKNFFLRTASFIIISLTVLSALAQMNFDVQTFVAGLGVTGLIVGFALKDTLSNFASGLLLLIYRPFRAGELIEVEGAHGIVEELTIVNMRMTTSEGMTVIMPNSKVWGAKITNFSRSQHRRLSLELRVRLEDAERAAAQIKSALEVDKRFLISPPPAVRISAISHDAATLEITPWTSSDQFVATTADVYIKLKKVLEEAGIQIL